MTREEAIRWLISVKEEVDEYESTMIYISDKEADALGMAIEALQADRPKPTGDLISRADAIALAKEPITPTGDATFDNAREWEREGFVDELMELPSADRPTGEWIFEKTDEYKRTYCSVCGASAPFICISEDIYGRRLHGRRRKTKFCPNCGADMRGEIE